MYRDATSVTRGVSASSGCSSSTPRWASATSTSPRIASSGSAVAAGERLAGRWPAPSLTARAGVHLADLDARLRPGHSSETRCPVPTPTTRPAAAAVSIQPRAGRGDRVPRARPPCATPFGGSRRERQDARIGGGAETGEDRRALGGGPVRGEGGVGVGRGRRLGVRQRVEQRRDRSRPARRNGNAGTQTCRRLTIGSPGRAAGAGLETGARGRSIH